MSFDHRRRLLDNIIRLRRAERAAPQVRDIVTVRATLEDELGATVSRRLAASALGVSHTALARWIRAGDVPVVPNPRGRQEVPVAQLLDLVERVERERSDGRRHVIESAMTEGRRRARSLSAEDLLGDLRATDDQHDRARRRSLAYHRAVARLLRRPMVDDARHVIWEWREQGRIDEHYASAWEQVLDHPVAQIRRLIAEDTPTGDDLRQNSPFAGVLSEPERAEIQRQVH